MKASVSNGTFFLLSWRILFLTPDYTSCYFSTIMKTVKIGDKEYKEIKALAKQGGYFLQFLLNDAIRQYIAAWDKPRKEKP